jgi:putative ABC transport system permease protein
VTRIRTLLSRACAVFRRDEIETEMNEEIRSHVEELEEDYRRSGLSAQEAHRRAVLAFGGIEQVKERYRDRYRLPALDSVLQDIVFATRMLVKHPGFTVTGIVTLALGIGGNTAIFSIVNAVLLKPAPFPDPDRLVMFMTTGPGTQVSITSPARFQYLRTLSTIQDAAAFRTGDTGVLTYTAGTVTESLHRAQVSADYFKLFAVPIVQGRGFSREDLPNGPKVVLIGYNLWARRFASDPNIIGETLSLSGEPYVVIGIVGPTFDASEFGPVPEVWTAFQLDPNTTDQGQSFQAAGRLKPGFTLQEAREEFKKAAADYRQVFPNALLPGVGFTVEPIQQALVGNASETLLVLSGAVSLVLLIACANVANLLLMRATTRKREIAIRALLGAGRARMIRQLLTESILLSLAGGSLGILFGIWGVRRLLSVNTAGLPRVGEDGALVDVDWRVLGFTLLISLGTGILFGLIPALQGSRSDLNASLKESGRGMGASFKQKYFRSTLVVVEIALSVTLLIGSSLFIRTQLALSSVDSGFQTTNVLTMRMYLTKQRSLHTADVAQVVNEGVDRIRSLPGVVDVAATSSLPLQLAPGGPFRIMGRPLANGPFHGGALWTSISSGYFQVFRIPIRRGRAFTDRDDASAPPVVIINESMAKHYWTKGDDPLNARILIAKGLAKQFDDEPERQIVGIVGDVRDRGLNLEPGPSMYVPQAQVPDAVTARGANNFPIAWVIRGNVAASSLSRAIQEQLRQVTGLPLSEIQTMDNVVSSSISRQRFNTLLMTVFACLALALAAIGTYGLMAYSVEQRTPEIGIRLALGAEAADVRRMIVLQGMRLVVFGVVIGVPLAFNLTKFIQGFLFGVEPWEPVTFVTVPVVVSVTALLAVWLPARRASRTSPIDALRYE